MFVERGASTLKKYAKLIRPLLLLGMVGLIFLLLYFAFVSIMPGLWPVLREGDEAAIEEYLRGVSSISGMLCMALLQFVQVVSIVLPGMPIQIAGGIVYGTVRGFAVCHLAFVAANAAVFAVARRLGNRLDAWLPTESGGKKDKLIAWLNTSDPGFMVLLACMMPGVPNGIIPHAAARTDLSLAHFTLSVYIASFFPILTMCFLGERILTGGLWLSVVFCGLLLLGIFLLYRNRMRVLPHFKRLQLWLDEALKRILHKKA